MLFRPLSRPECDYNAMTCAAFFNDRLMKSLPQKIQLSGGKHYGGDGHPPQGHHGEDLQEVMHQDRGLVE
jgi:hypothetical protein